MALEERTHRGPVSRGLRLLSSALWELMKLYGGKGSGSVACVHPLPSSVLVLSLTSHLRWDWIP